MAINSSSPKSQQGLKQRIYADLKNKLINCVYAPGTILNESKLTEEYGVSRTPVREALNRLEMEGYVEILPKKGIYIPDFTLEDAMQIFHARMEIEPVSLKLAVPYLEIQKLMDFKHRFETQEFDSGKSHILDSSMHLYIIDRCRNRYIIDMMHRLFDDNTRIIVFTGQNVAGFHDAQREHIEILDALISMQDPDSIAEMMREHIITCRNAALSFFNSEEYRKRGE